MTKRILIALSLIIISLVFGFGSLLLVAANEEGMLSNSWIISILTNAVRIIKLPGNLLEDNLSVQASFELLYLFGITFWATFLYISFLIIEVVLSKAQTYWKMR